MARIRTVKPELFRHDELFEVERQSGLPIRIAFVGLFTICDREGRFKWKPKRLKVEVLPYDDIDFDDILNYLHSFDFIEKYRDSSGVYGVIPNFKKHQIINNRESESELPSPENCEILNHEIDACLTRAPHVADASRSCLSGREGKGKEGKGKEEEKKQTKKENSEIEPSTVTAAPSLANKSQAVVGSILEHANNLTTSTSEQKPNKSKKHAEEVVQVFDYWRKTLRHEQAKLDDKRKKKIRNALKLGYSVSELCSAIDGCANSAWHMGQNDRGKVFDSVDLIFRDADRIDKFIAIDKQPEVIPLSKTEQQTRRNAEIAFAWANEISNENEGLGYDGE